MNSKTVLLLASLLASTQGYASVDITKNHLMDNSQTIYSQPSPTNGIGLNDIGGISRTGPLGYTAQGQNRDSYSSVTTQGGYSVGGSNAAGSVGTTGSGNAIHAAGSTVTTTYGVPAAGGATVGGGWGHNVAAGTNPLTYYYYHYPGATVGNAGAAHGWGETTGYGDDDDGSALGGLGGLAGLLGLKGLKGLGGIGLLALFKLFKPLLLPLLLAPLLLLLLPLLLLFLPIPIMSVSASRQVTATSIADIMSEKVYDGVHLAHQVMTGSQCLERIACEINRKSQGTFVDGVVRGLIEKSENYVPKKWRRAMRAYMDAGSVPESKAKCVNYTCDSQKAEPTARLNSKLDSRQKASDENVSTDNVDNAVNKP